MIIILPLVFLSLIITILIKFIYEVVWIPFHLQRSMRSQGIIGPSYKFIHGNAKESLVLWKQAADRPMELSHDIFPKIHPQFYAWMTLYGKNFLTWNGAEPHVVITEPELVKEILTNKEGMFPKVKVSGAATRKLLGDGLIMADGEKWLKLRKLANHALYAENLKDMVPAMISSVKTMLANWKLYEGKEFEISKELVLLSSEVISRTAFGSSYLEGKNIFEMLTKLGNIVMKNTGKIRPWGIEKILKSQDVVRLEEMEKSLSNSIMEIVRKREEKVLAEKTNNFGSDYLGILLTARHEADKKKRISIDNVIDECKVVYLSGYGTTSSFLCWSCFLLALHIDWQEKARKEVFELFGLDEPTAERLSRLKTISMIINETLRLYSPAYSIVRRSKSKVKLGKYVFPANMKLHIPVLALHRDPEIWGSDAHLFKPERFEEGVAKATRNNPWAFLPFGYGPGSCVGLNLAINEAKIALLMILQRYKFTLSPNYVHTPVPVLTTRQQNGIQIILQPL